MGATYGVSEDDGEVGGVGVDAVPCERVRARRGPPGRVVGCRHLEGSGREREREDGGERKGVHLSEKVFFQSACGLLDGRGSAKGVEWARCINEARVLWTTARR